MYGFHRFTDTLVGLVVALLVNVVIRPYNNRQKIINTMDEIQKCFCRCCSRACSSIVIRI